MAQGDDSVCQSCQQVVAHCVCCPWAWSVLRTAEVSMALAMVSVLLAMALVGWTACAEGLMLTLCWTKRLTVMSPPDHWLDERRQ